MTKKLTPKQKMFVKEYLIDLNATQACIRAGYEKKHANRMATENLSKLVIQEAIQKSMALREKRTLVSSDYVIGTLKELAERCMQRIPVLDAKGQQITEDGQNVWRFDSSGANKALDSLGRHLGLFTEKVEHNGGDKPVEIKHYISPIVLAILEGLNQKQDDV